MKKQMALLCVIVFAIPLFSQETIYFDAANPPFMYGSEGIAYGIYPAIIQEIYRRIDKPVKCISLPWVRALSEVKTTKSGIAGIYYNSERAKYLDFSEPIFQENLTIYTLQGSTMIQSMKDLEKLRIGVIRGWSYGNEFDAMIKKKYISVEANVSDMLNFKKLIEKRLDAVIAVDVSGDSIVDALRVKDVVLKNAYSIKLDVYLAFNKSMHNADDLRRINKEINELKANGTIDHIAANEMNGYQF